VTDCDRLLESTVKGSTQRQKTLENSGTKGDNTKVLDEVVVERSTGSGEGQIMKVASAYIHALEGRLRIKVVEMKGRPGTAWELEGKLQTLDGVDEATVNPRTGNVLVLYDPALTNQHELVDALRSWGYLRDDGIEAGGGRGGIGISRDSLTNTLVRSSVEFALQQLLTALI
jgi:copper chaperone CopZ